MALCSKPDAAGQTLPQAPPLTPVHGAPLRRPSNACFGAGFTQHLSSQTQAPLGHDVLRPKPALRPSTPRATTPADLLGVAHGLQHGVVQGLQGSQDVLIVPHVVHKVVWVGGNGKQRSKVAGASHPSPGFSHHHLFPSPQRITAHAVWVPTQRHLPQSSLVSTWLHAERHGGSETGLSPPAPQPSTRLPPG